MKHLAWTTLLVAAPLFAASPALAAFQCPAADPGGAGNAPALDVGDLDGPGVSAGLQAAIRHMLAQGMKSGEIVDRLVVADCRRVDAQAKLSDDGKAEQVRRFAATIANFVYTAPGPNQEDIVLDVSVPTARYEQLHQAATKAGVSEGAWVNEAIAAKLGKP